MLLYGNYRNNKKAFGDMQLKLICRQLLYCKFLLMSHILLIYVFLSLRVFKLLSSSLLLFAQHFG